MPKAPQPDQAPKEGTPEPTGEPETTDQAPAAPPAPKRARKAPAKAPTGTPRNATSLFVSLEDSPEYARALLYGREGSGKTTSAMTLANYGPILVVNAEGGIRKTPLRKLGVNLDNIRVWAPNDEHPLSHASLEQVYRQVSADLKRDPQAWTGVVFDSATDIVEALVSRVAGLRLDGIRQRGTTLDEVDLFNTDRNDYGVMSKMFRDILRKFRDLPCHLVVTALERRDVDEDTSRVAYGPAVPPALANDLLGYVDLALYMRAEDDGGPFRALARRRGPYRAKDRTGTLPPVLAHPTMERVVQYVSEHLHADTDPTQELLLVKDTDEGKKGKSKKKG